MKMRALEQQDIHELWEQLVAKYGCSMQYPVWQYLQGQNVEALVDYDDKFLCDLKLASSLEEEIPRLAFAVRDCGGRLVNILELELQGLLLLANVGKHYRLVSEEASVAGASVHFGEPQERLGVAISPESAMAASIAANGLPCWACLGPTGLGTLRVPESVREVCVFCDAETSGIVEEAAAALAERLRATGRSVAVVTPPCEALGLFGNVRWHDAWMMAGNELLHL